MSGYRGKAAGGHFVRLSAETYARAILAAGQQKKHVNDFAEWAVVQALAIHDRQTGQHQPRDEWRPETSTSTPRPIQRTTGPKKL